MASPNQTKPNGAMTRLLFFFSLYFLLGIFVIMVSAYVVIASLVDDLPPLASLENIRDEQALSTEIYSADGQLLRAFAREKRFWVRYDEVPQCVIDAVMAIEDQRFYKHWGFSVPDFFRALWVDIKTFTLAQGGSTLTQQLAKKLYLDSDKNIMRKIEELLTSIQIERTYTKQEIMELYLNRMEFSPRTFGIQAASQLYFSKNTAELNITEAAMLAGILQNPSRIYPLSDLESRRTRAVERRNLVLRVMAEWGKIPYHVYNEEKTVTLDEMLATDGGGGFGIAPYFTEHVRGELIDRFGEQTVMTEGLKVTTTLDTRLQSVAEEALNTHLATIQENYADHLIYERPPGLTDEEAEADSLRKTKVQGALIAMDVRTGQVVAMVGGVGNYGENYFNRTTQATRQAGSVFKPFLYTAALDNDWRCSDTLIDAYVIFENVDHQGNDWAPQNFEEDYVGKMSLREAMIHSRNVPAAKLMNDTDNRGVRPEVVLQYARKFGLTTLEDGHAVHSLAIGTAPVKLIEMVTAFNVFPNLGVKTEPFTIGRVADKNNTMIYQQPGGEGKKSEVLDPAVASLMLNMLRSVAIEGTAANTLRRLDMYDRPSGGKTGTGNEYKDAWFIGFTPYLVCGVWVGFDSEETTLGGNAFGTGASAALPVWTGFIKGASEILGYPKSDFEYTGITSQRICRESYKKATNNCPDSSTYIEYFIPGTELTEECPIHGTRRDDIIKPFYVPRRDGRGF